MFNVTLSKKTLCISFQFEVAFQPAILVVERRRTHFPPAHSHARTHSIMSTRTLIAAARMCDAMEIQHIVEQGHVDINAQDSTGNTALHWLAFTSNNAMKGPKVMDAIAMALMLGASRDICNREGLTPLHVAARVGSKIALKALLQNFGSLREARLTKIAQSFSPVINGIKQYMSADRATLFLVDGKRKKLTASVATQGDDHRSGVLSIDMEWTQGVVGLCLQTILADNQVEMNAKKKKWVKACACKCKSPLRVLVSDQLCSFHLVCSCLFFQSVQPFKSKKMLTKCSLCTCTHVVLNHLLLFFFLLIVECA